METKRVLIIEDEEIITVVIETFLNKLGHTVVDSVSKGEDAIDVAQKTKPDLIISDIMLDGILNGIETVKEILKHIESDIIFMTSHPDPRYEREANGINYLEFLHKPVTFDMLRNILSKN